MIRIGPFYKMLNILYFEYMTYIEILTFKMGNVFEFEFIVLSSCDSDALSLSLTPLNITRLLEPPLMEFDVLSDDLKLFFRFG